jgi:hypothetical protein
MKILALLTLSIKIILYSICVMSPKVGKAGIFAAQNCQGFFLQTINVCVCVCVCVCRERERERERERLVALLSLLPILVGWHASAVSLPQVMSFCPAGLPLYDIIFLSHQENNLSLYRHCQTIPMEVQLWPIEMSLLLQRYLWVY